MIEYITVIAVVSVAALYVGRKLLRQMKGRGCDDCDCASKTENSTQLIQISSSKKPGNGEDS
ncbi:MAG: hypothetical protein KKG33_06400 [candidate division Zixibacteria bacterium]|nr:hypothetical protein [candidate division Zixibacteria bacterium]MBU1471729.1 hypothetical protein [candidate division Zixibacteria bacterium]MBU2625173.1 hypothetical protein [candidate division Zixibacteria bacterium]